MDEQIKALPRTPKGTHDDDYDEEWNLVLTSKIMVTTVYDDGNMIGNDNQLVESTNDSNHASHLISDVISISDILSDSDCVIFGAFSNFTDLFDWDSEKGSSNSHSSYFSPHCWRQRKNHRHYNTPPLPFHSPHENKHKKWCHGIHFHFNDDCDNVSDQGIQVPVDDDSFDAGEF